MFRSDQRWFNFPLKIVSEVYVSGRLVFEQSLKYDVPFVQNYFTAFELEFSLSVVYKHTFRLFKINFPVVKINDFSARQKLTEIFRSDRDMTIFLLLRKLHICYRVTVVGKDKIHQRVNGEIPVVRQSVDNIFVRSTFEQLNCRTSELFDDQLFRVVRQLGYIVVFNKVFPF